MSATDGASDLPSAGVASIFNVVKRTQLTSQGAAAEFDTFWLDAVFGLLDRFLASNVADNRPAEAGEAGCSRSG